jgi:hypothetical protein
VTDRTILALFAVVALAAGAAVIVPLHDHFAKQDAAAAFNTAESKGLRSRSLIRTANVQRVLAEVERQSPADALVQDVLLHPADLVVVVEDPASGSRRSFDLGSDGKISAGGTSDATADYGVRFAQIDPSVPERVAREALARAHRTDDDSIDYVTASISPPHQMHWVIALLHGPVRDRMWIADADGTHVKRQG